MTNSKASSDKSFGHYKPSRFMQKLIQFARGRSESWASKRLAFLARRIGLSCLKTPLDLTAFEDVKMRLYPFANICEKRILFTPQYFDASEREALKDVISKPNSVFIDIGANVGGYALYAAHYAGAASHIYAIEPQPDIYERLCFNIEANQYEHVIPIAQAISDKKGEVTLFIDPKNKGESSMKHVSADTAQTISSLKVQALPLTEFCDDHKIDHIDALKLDVEGAEDLILVHFFANADVALHPRLIILENGQDSWQSDLDKLLLDKGYQLKLQTRLNSVYILKRKEGFS